MLWLITGLGIRLGITFRYALRVFNIMYLQMILTIRLFVSVTSSYVEYMTLITLEETVNLLHSFGLFGSRYSAVIDGGEMKLSS